MTPISMTAVVTGGTSGIGAAMVSQFSAAGYQVAFTGTRSLESVPETLRALPNSLYVQGDAGNIVDVVKLREETHRRFGADLGQLHVIANAGIDAVDTETEKVERLRKTNIEGPRYLLDLFADDLASTAASRFVAVGSIVGTMGVVLPQNVEYQASKAAVEELVRSIEKAYPSVYGITLSPGFIRTGMTDGSVVNGLIFRMAAVAAVGDADLRAAFAPFAGGEDKLGQTPADIFTGVLGEAFTSNPIYRVVEKAFKKDPALGGNMQAMMAVKAAQDKVLNARMAEALEAADVLISPASVSQTLFNELETPRTPRGGVLEAFQSRGAAVAPIVRLLSPLRPSAG